MRDMREFRAPAAGETSTRSKLLAAGLVAAGIAAGGAYAYLSPGVAPVKPAARVAVNEPIALTPPGTFLSRENPSNPRPMPANDPRPAPIVPKAGPAPETSASASIGVVRQKSGVRDGATVSPAAQSRPVQADSQQQPEPESSATIPDATGTASAISPGPNADAPVDAQRRPDPDAAEPQPSPQ